MNDKEIIEMLFDRAESALDEISRKYSGLYRNIIGQALSDPADVEECSNDLLLAIWDTIPPNKPERLQLYICKLAKRISIDRFRYNTRQKRGEGYTVLLSELEDSIPDVSSMVSSNDGELTRVITQFLKELDAETRMLFVRRYIYFESVASLAVRFEMSENHVAVQLHRARNKLKKLLEKEGIYV